MDLRGLFPPPEDAGRGIERHRYMLSRALLNPAMERAIADAVGRHAREVWGVAPRAQSAASEAAAAEIDRRGWAALDPWDPETVAALRAALDSLPLYAKAGAARSDALSIEAAQAHNVAEMKAEDLLRLPQVLDFVREPTALAAAEALLSGPPTLLALVGWWSFPGHQARDAQLFHLDVDDHRFVKHFLYLTDVDAQSGPHAYVEGTHRPEDYAALIGRGDGPAGQKRIFDWLFQSLRKSDADVERMTGKRPTLIQGAAGTRFIASTRGLHKGVPPQSRPRLVLQATYGVSPTGGTPSARLPASDLPIALAAPADRRLFWLFVDPAG